MEITQNDSVTRFFIQNQIVKIGNDATRIYYIMECTANVMTLNVS